MQTMAIRVSNVKCAGCASNIQQGLGELAQVHTVSVDIPQGLVTVEGDALPEETIRTKLSALGYPPVD